MKLLDSAGLGTHCNVSPISNKLIARVNENLLVTESMLAGGFKSLNLDSGMASKFIPVILSFVQSKGGDIVKNLLEKALR